MKKIIILLFVFLMTKPLFAIDLSVSASLGLSGWPDFNTIEFSNGAYSYGGPNFNIAMQLTLREVVQDWFSALNVMYEPVIGVDSARIQRAPGLFSKTIVVLPGIGRSFNIGYAKADIMFFAGYSMQTLYGYYYIDTVTVTHNAACLGLGVKVRSPVFSHLYLNFGLKYLHKKDKTHSGTLDRYDYDINIYGKRFLTNFGLEFVFK